MTHSEFEALVSRLEAYAARSPRGYHLRVALLACLGYASLFLVLAIVLALVGGIVTAMMLTKNAFLLLKLAVGPLVLAAALLRSLKVSIPEPQGLRIERPDAPQLFCLLDALRTQLKSPPFHRVLLTREMNASVAQIPKFGLFGWHNNYLILGLPLMQALTPEQFKAVVAHEVGHLSGSHSRFSGWIHRVRLIWVQVLENLHRDKQRRAAAWLGRFFEWYAPYFSAYTFVLARQNEYEADRCAAEVTGADVMAQALIASQVRGRFWNDRFWPNINKQAEEKSQPPPVFTTIGAALQSSLLPEDAQQFFHHALSQKTGIADTHPSLSDRLHALGCQTASEQMGRCFPSGTSWDTAAAYFLGQSLSRAVDQLEAEWQQRVSSGWEKRYRQVQEGRQRLAALNVQAQEQELSEEERWTRAQLTAEFGQPESAAALLSEIVTANSTNTSARMALGQILLQQGDACGLMHLKAAMEIEPDVTMSACQTAFDFCKQHGREAEADQFRCQAAERRQLLIKAQAEREIVETSAQFEAHGLSPDALAELTNQIRSLKEIKKDIKAAYLVRKKVQFLPEHPLYVLWLVPPVITRTSHQNIVNKIAPQIRFSGQMRIHVSDGSDLRLIRIRRLPQDALIYRKGQN